MTNQEYLAIERWPFVTADNLKGLPSSSGCYAVVMSGVVSYVGMTTSINGFKGRWSSHEQKYRVELYGAQIHYFEMPIYSQIRELELILIRGYWPSWNIQDKKNPLPGAPWAMGNIPNLNFDIHIPSKRYVTNSNWKISEPLEQDSETIDIEESLRLLEERYSPKTEIRSSYEEKEIDIESLLKRVDGYLVNAKQEPRRENSDSLNVEPKQKPFLQRGWTRFLLLSFITLLATISPLAPFFWFSLAMVIIMAIPFSIGAVAVLFINKAVKNSKDSDSKTNGQK